MPSTAGRSARVLILPSKLRHHVNSSHQSIGVPSSATTFDGVKKETGTSLGATLTPRPTITHLNHSVFTPPAKKQHHFWLSVLLKTSPTYQPTTHLRHAGDCSPRHAGLIGTTKRAVKKRKLTAGQIVVARDRSGEDPSGRKWRPAKVIDSMSRGSYR